MNRLERQFLVMAAISIASLVAFLGYFFFPRSWGESALTGSKASDNETLKGFVPVGAAWGIVFEHQRLAELPDIGHVIGSGLVLADLNGDGMLDVYLLNASPAAGSGHQPSALYLNRGNRRFELASDAGDVDPGGLNMGVTAADYDGDGDLDMYITRLGPDLLFANDGTGRFRDVTFDSGIDNRKWGTGAAWADYDRDGDLDLFVANYLAFDPDRLPTEVTIALDRDEEAAFNPYLFKSVPDVLYRNEGDGTFTDVTDEAGIVDVDGKGLGVAFADFNNDGWPDIYVVNDVSANALYVNQGDGRFIEQGSQAGVADPRGGMGITVGDYDCDGYLDIFSTHWQDEVNVLYRNLGPSGGGGATGFDLTFEDVTAAAGLTHSSRGLTGWGVAFFDADHDGDLDLYWTNGYTSPGPGGGATCVPLPDRLMMNDRGRYTDMSIDLLAGVPVSAGRGLAVGDLDQDGDLDVVRIANNGAVAVLENQTADGHWLIVRPAGHPIVGCRVVVTCGGREQMRTIEAGTSFLSCGPREVHFGVGLATSIPRVEVIWPDGRRRSYRNVEVNQRLLAEPDE